MKVGLLTNVFGNRSIVEICRWAKENKFEAIEIGSVTPLIEEEFKIAIKETGIEIISFAYCRNFLSEKKSERKEYYQNLIQRIELASKLGIKYVTTSTGKDESKSLEENIPLVVDFFEPIIKKAKEKGVTIAFENCPAVGNIAISPYIWRKILKKHPSFDLKLVYDPSHFIWQGIDCYRPLKEFINQLVYVHAKDTRILKDELEDKGILDKGWWQACIPGWGVIEWKKIISTLMEEGFDGVLSIEHEDPVWGKGEEKIKKSLIMTKNYLESLIPDTA